MQNGIKVVNNLQPWFDKELQTKGLADRLCEVEQLMYLYPNQPKMQAFQQYRKVRDAPNKEHPGMSSDYVASLEVTVVLADQLGGMNMNANH